MGPLTSLYGYFTRVFARVQQCAQITGWRRFNSNGMRLLFGSADSTQIDRVGKLWSVALALFPVVMERILGRPRKYARKILKQYLPHTEVTLCGGWDGGPTVCVPGSLTKLSCPSQRWAHSPCEMQHGPEELTQNKVMLHPSVRLSERL